MEEKVFLGTQWGSFQDEKGRTVNYCHVFFFEPFPEGGNPDYHTYGYRAGKYKLADIHAADGLEPLQPVEVYFSSKGAVTKMERTTREPQASGAAA